MTATRRLPNYPPCFICGDENECGTQMRWEQVEGGVEGRYRGVDRHRGYEGILHGGVIAGLLDECAGWAAALRCRAMCFTGELKVRYLRPVPTGVELRVRGTSPESPGGTGKYVVALAEIVDEGGTLYASCEGKFFPMPPELSSQALAKLAFRDEGAAEDLFPSPKA